MDEEAPDDLRNYPSPWWQLWLQRAALVAVGVWAAFSHGWLAVGVAVIALAAHVWMVHKFRQQKIARDAWFEEVMRDLS